MRRSSKNLRDVFCGIDVSCGKKKPLPICFVEHSQHRLNVLSVPRLLAASIPLGLGNGEIAMSTPFRAQAIRTAAALKMIADELEWNIVRTAIDAPAKPPSGCQGRACEVAMGLAGLSYFKTPSVSQWEAIKSTCSSYLHRGGALTHLPSANRIWMLFGFELFDALRVTGSELIETYPQAVIRSLLPICEHKSSEEGYQRQLVTIAEATGWSARELEIVLARNVRGSRHDRLDAYMTAWIASMPKEGRKAFGRETDNLDAIWVPLL